MQDHPRPTRHRTKPPFPPSPSAVAAAAAARRSRSQDLAPLRRLAFRRTHRPSPQPNTMLAASASASQHWQPATPAKTKSTLLPPSLPSLSPLTAIPKAMCLKSLRGRGGGGGGGESSKGFLGEDRGEEKRGEERGQVENYRTYEGSQNILTPLSLSPTAFLHLRPSRSPSS